MAHAKLFPAMLAVTSQLTAPHALMAAQMGHAEQGQTENHAHQIHNALQEHAQITAANASHAQMNATCADAAEMLHVASLILTDALTKRLALTAAQAEHA